MKRAAPTVLSFSYKDKDGNPMARPGASRYTRGGKLVPMNPYMRLKGPRPRGPITGAGDPTWANGIVYGLANIGLGGRQLALYAAAIGQKRGVLPLDLAGWALVRRDGETVTFEKRKPAPERAAWLPRARPEGKVEASVVFDLSFDALHTWPGEPIDESIVEPAPAVERVAA